MDLTLPHKLTPLSPEVAAEWTSNWRKAATVFNFNLKGFTVRVEELKELMEMLPHSDVIRFYLAMNNDPTQGAEGMHLVFCGVDSHGNDVIYPTNSDTSVFDLTNPCPPVCGKASCLNSDIKCER